ncbi:hypothetical protein A1O3_08186 [Capronia epimyces CBS 606.96]|uniref:Pre-rRNA-processing protein RIX1 n=1 Tax=Capronia epimyces CBS 606.96 TaxID=1182542 RepID=W9XSG7_9EURO|nr:uncharacterized protein A1O3_08186 [Capronia epimyces CBS 606.96]EXJ79901.1 hypothetical protein A1O3_08186 [Capronia epimyces CBS 606.96]
MQADSSLRAITNRLSVTPVEDLPRICGFLANQLANCSLESQFSGLKGSSSSVTTHKLKTRIGSLLQDRSASGRLAAAVLIKAVVEHGGSNAVSASEGWARGLLGCLNKPDATELKKLYLITTTRIFVLTQNHPHLLREVTTPLLPHFIKTCLVLIKPVETQGGERSTRVPSPLLDTVLRCWAQLLPQHATVFRPELARIKAICHGLLGSEESSTSSRELAIKLLCLLLSCASKNTFSQEWSQIVLKIISAAHETVDQLFRAVLEEYESNDPARQQSIGKQDFSHEPHLVGPDSTGLEPWTGIYQGSLRLSTLLAWLGSLLSTPESQTVGVPVGRIVDLTARIAAVTVPTSPEPLKYHKEASREEKEELRMNLPLLHVSCLRLLHIMCTTYGQALLSIYRTMASQAAALLQALPDQEGVRQGVYDIFGFLLEASNPNDIALSRDGFSALVTECCYDLRRAVPGLEVRTKTNDATEASLKVNSALTANNTQEKSARYARPFLERPDVYASAWSLLPKLLKHGSWPPAPRQLRTEMDRLSVLLGHREAMLASVMRPVLSKSGKANGPSLLPFLARSAANDFTVEALLRPRMPVVQVDPSPAPHSPLPQVSPEPESEEDDRQPSDDTRAQVVGDSFTEQDSSSRRAVEGIVSGNGLQDIVTKKRTYIDVDESLPEITIPQETNEEREAKRLRPEQGLTYASTSIREEWSKEDAARDNLPETRSASSLAGADSRPQMGISASDPVSGPSGRRGPAVEPDGDDSDDSEIPTIDAGLDTDEEDE